MLKNPEKFRENVKTLSKIMKNPRQETVKNVEKPPKIFRTFQKTVKNFEKPPKNSQKCQKTTKTVENLSKPLKVCKNRYKVQIMSENHKKQKKM